jgi:uncharacterized RDD family membrane protein YckC
MTDTWTDADRRHAEWFSWAKREVSGDDRVCQGVAAAALEAEQNGADTNTARQAGRDSVLGRAVVLREQVPSERRAYAEWYDWARRHVKGEPERLHIATQAALQAMRDGGDAGAATRAARNAAGLPERAPEAQRRTEADGDPRPPARVPPPPDSPRNFYAGFWVRFTAFLLDGAILSIVLLVLGFLIFIFYVLGGGSQSLTGLLVFTACFLVIVTWLYRAGLESSGWQATFGKRIMGIAVVGRTGERLSFGRASARFVAEWLSLLIVGTGFLVSLANSRRQALHDLIGGTLVIRKEYAFVAPSVLAHLAAPRQPVQPPSLEFRG